MVEFNTFEKEKMINEATEYLEKLGYHPQTRGVTAIVDAWWNANKDAIELASKHPNYLEGKYMIALSESYERKVDVDGIKKFKYWIGNKAYSMKDSILKKIDTNWSKYELQDMTNSLVDKIRVLQNGTATQVSGGYRRENLPELRSELDKYTKLLFTVSEFNGYTKESQYLYNIVKNNLFDHIVSHINSDRFDKNLNEEMKDDFNTLAELCGMKVKFSKGQKIMKVIRKFLESAGITSETEGWNENWASLGDAINPLKYERHTIISWNLIDFLRMSMGTSWTSCHTIDKANIEERDGDSYEGMHASGTLSYALDSSSCVFYTIHKEYDGQDFEWEDKVSRQMWHIGTPENPCMINGRLYPQANDSGSADLYKQTRETMENIISTIWNQPNYWSVKNDITEARKTVGGSTHYPDYDRFNFSKYIKLQTDKEFKKIEIGSRPICIECGARHSIKDELSCCHSFNNRYQTCSNCGDRLGTEDMRYIDGEYYCEECCFYCEYHGEYEPYNSIYIDGHGDVCANAAYESGNFYRCEYCGVWHSFDDDHYSIDDYIYCSESCTRNDGWTECAECGEWIRESNAYMHDYNYYCDEICAGIENEVA